MSTVPARGSGTVTTFAGLPPLCLSLSAMTSSLQAWYYFAFGLSVALYILILIFQKDSSTNSSSAPASGSTSGKDIPVKRIYLNLFFIDRTEFIHNIVRSKVPKSRPLVRALAKRAAAALLKDGIVTKVSQGLCKTVQAQMAKMGLKCTVNLVFSQAAFAALEMSVQSLDLHQFFVYGAGPAAADKIIDLLNRFSLPAVTEFLKRYLIGVVVGKLLVQLPNTIKEKLYNKMNTAIEVVACNEEEQGPFFVQMISQLNEGATKDSSKDPVIAKELGKDGSAAAKAQHTESMDQ